MTTADRFREVMRERRQHERGTPDHEYRTNAARKLWWLVIGKPACEWSN